MQRAPDSSNAKEKKNPASITTATHMLSSSIRRQSMNIAQQHPPANKLQ
jgi:hypothetical protein